MRLGLVVKETSDIVEYADLFVGFDSDETVILLFGDERATWLAQLRCIELIGTMSIVATL